MNFSISLNKASWWQCWSLVWGKGSCAWGSFPQLSAFPVSSSLPLSGGAQFLPSLPGRAAHAGGSGCSAAQLGRWSASPGGSTACETLPAGWSSWASPPGLPVLPVWLYLPGLSAQPLSSLCFVWIFYCVFFFLWHWFILCKPLALIFQAVLHPLFSGIFIMQTKSLSGYKGGSCLAAQSMNCWQDCFTLFCVCSHCLWPRTCISCQCVFLYLWLSVMPHGCTFTPASVHREKI